MEVEPTVLAEPDPELADSLVSSNDPDDLANEQTWPTEDEMKGAETTPAGEDTLPDAKLGTTPKVVKRIPKGMSEYQAAWIIDESDEEDQEEGGSDGEMQAGEEEEMQDMPLVPDEPETDQSQRDVHFDLDDEEEDKQYVVTAFLAALC